MNPPCEKHLEYCGLAETRAPSWPLWKGMILRTGASHLLIRNHLSQCLPFRSSAL